MPCCFIDPPMAAIVAWLVGMTTRQCGHFFFEPKGYDHVNEATHEHKEEIKVGYNLQRKVVLMAIWALLPISLLVNPTRLRPRFAIQDWPGYLRQVGTAWLALGIAGVLFRMVQLFVIEDVRCGLVWVTKILTDPFHDMKLYHKAPLRSAAWRADRSRPSRSTTLTEMREGRAKKLGMSGRCE